MARSQITSSGQDVISDGGAVLISVLRGEQQHIAFTANWLTDLTGYTIEIKVVEGLNLGDGEKPEAVRPAGVTSDIPIIDTIVADNTFTIVIPKDLGSTWVVKPTPDKAVYGFIDVSISDPGTGNEQQIWKPLSGLIEICYSPTEG